MSRFWLAVARFAAKRCNGYALRPWREITDEEYLAAYADAEPVEITGTPATWPLLPKAPTFTGTSTLTDVTWTPRT